MNFNKFKEIFEIFKDNIIKIYLNNPISKKIRLKKIEKALTIVDLEKVKEVISINNVKKENVFINQQNKVLYKYIENFINVMNMNFKEEDLNNLYNNIIWVMFKKYNSLFYGGEYCSIDNIIKYIYEEDDTSINHELLHLSSNSYDELSDNNGFKYDIGGYQIGYGLDEGYTELLNKRYFESETENIYTNQIIICKYLEKIIGKEKMEKFYLNANLFGIINELKKYYSLNEIERFICAVDFTEEYDHTRRYLSIVENDETYSQYETIISFLFKGYSSKLHNTNNYDLEVISFITNLVNELDFDIDDTLIEELNKNKNVNLDINMFKQNKNVL